MVRVGTLDRGLRHLKREEKTNGIGLLGNKGGKKIYSVTRWNPKNHSHILGAWNFYNLVFRHKEKVIKTKRRSTGVIRGR